MLKQVSTSVHMTGETLEGVSTNMLEDQSIQHYPVTIVKNLSDYLPEIY